GGQLMAEVHESQQLLSTAEEKALADRIHQMTITGHPLKYSLIREIAEELRQHRLADIDDDGIQYINYEPIGQEWFINHYPQLKMVYSKTIEVPQVKDVTYETVERFYDELKYMIDEFEISPENCYNMDETGSSIGTIQGGHIIIYITAQTKYELEI